MTASWNDVGPQQALGPTEDRLSEICAQVFTTPAGKELLVELRKKYFELGGNPMAEERALRVRATQQQFVRDLELACDRGLKRTST